MSRASWRTFIAGVALTAMAATNVSAQDNPGVPDTASGTSSFSDVQNAADGDIVAGFGFASVFQTTPGSLIATATNYVLRIQNPQPGVTELARAGSFAYESDRIKRGFDFTTLNQRDFAAVSISAARVLTVGGVPTAVTFSGGGSSVEGCQSKIRMNDFTDADPEGPPFGPEDSFDNATVVTACSDEGLDNANMPSAGQDIMRSLFPRSNDGTGFKAKATDLPHV